MIKAIKENWKMVIGFIVAIAFIFGGLYLFLTMNESAISREQNNELIQPVLTIEGDPRDVKERWTVVNIACPKVLVERIKPNTREREQRVLEFPPHGYGTATQRIEAMLSDKSGKIRSDTVIYCRYRVRPGWIAVITSINDWSFFPPEADIDFANGVTDRSMTQSPAVN